MSHGQHVQTNCVLEILANEPNCVDAYHFHFYKIKKVTWELLSLKKLNLLNTGNEPWTLACPNKLLFGNTGQWAKIGTFTRNQRGTGVDYRTSLLNKATTAKMMLKPIHKTWKCAYKKLYINNINAGRLQKSSNGIDPFKPNWILTSNEAKIYCWTKCQCIFKVFNIMVTLVTPDQGTYLRVPWLLVRSRHPVAPACT